MADRRTPGGIGQVLAPGDVVAGYRIKRVLGQGGMGVVYEATQLSLNRTVALKFLSAHFLQDVDFRERFRREGVLQAGIDHPHIVPVYEAGEADEGLFLAMRLVRGPDLKELIAHGDLEPGRAIAILAQVADALDAAHRTGLTHRDIKPQNILVGEYDHGYLADFGLTKGSDVASITRTGQFLGTLDYIAPEQINGELATARSDLYSLAAVLYESLTGAVPYPRPAEAAVLFAHVTEPAPRVSDARPDLPAGLDDVIAWGMAKLPSERPDSARELLDASAEALGPDASSASAAQVRPPIRRAPSTRPKPAPVEPVTARTEVAPVVPVAPTRSHEVHAATRTELDVPAAASSTELDVPAAASSTEVDVPAATSPELDAPAPAASSTELDVPAASSTELDVPAASSTELDVAAASSTELDVPATGDHEAEARDASVSEPDESPSRPHDTSPVEPDRSVTEPLTDDARAPRRRSLAKAAIGVAVLVVAAVAAIVLTGGGEPEEPTRAAAPDAPVVEAGPLALRGPAGWDAREAPAIAGLELRDPDAVGNGDSVMVAGTTAAAGPTLLPADFTRRLPTPPEPGDAVAMGAVRAYRFADLRPDGAQVAMTVLVAPTSAGVATIACLGPDGDRARCEAAAGSLALDDGVRAAPLGPSARYARQLKTPLDKLRAQRGSALRELRSAKTPAGQARALSAVASAYGKAAASLRKIEPNPPERSAHAALRRAVARAGAAYRSLAVAAREERRKEYGRARTGARTADRTVNRALAEFVAFGYRVR